MAQVIEVDQSNFAAEVLASTVPVVVDYWADWCGPCHRIKPVVEMLATQFDGKVKFVKINVDESRDLARAAKIQGIPAFHVYRNGKLVDSMVGADPAGLKNLVQRAFSSPGRSL